MVLYKSKIYLKKIINIRVSVYSDNIRCNFRLVDSNSTELMTFNNNDIFMSYKKGRMKFRVTVIEKIIIGARLLRRFASIATACPWAGVSRE